jgi:penicillin-binding protein 2
VLYIKGKKLDYKNMKTQKQIQWKNLEPIKGEKVGGSTKILGWKSLYVYIISVAVFGVLFISVINLQVVHGREYQDRSERNRLEEHIVQPDRGIIYDRNGEKLVTNEPSFDVILNPIDLDKEQIDGDVTLLSEILEVSEDEIRDKYESSLETDSMVQKILIGRDVNRDKVLLIRSKSDDLPGVWIDYSSKRSYLSSQIYSHLVGYTGETDPDDIDENEDILLGDVIGKEGIESYYDKQLRGTKGSTIVEVDANQRVIAEYVNEGNSPVDGNSLYLSIDSGLQEKLYEILTAGVSDYDATAGVAVVEDVRTGELLSAVSVPSYDNNLFIGGIASSDYETLSTDPDLPLFNRIIAAQEPPGSMFKTIVASAALEEKAITKDTVFVSTGVMDLGNGYTFQEYHQKSYGALNLIGGLAKSSNIYFCNTMLELGIDNFVPYAEFFGIGSKTGIDLYGEMEGRIPSPENKLDLAEVSPWLDPVWYSEGDSCNSAIGQGITSVTPIQVVNWAATIANGGKVLKPHLAYKWSSSVSDEVDYVETDIVREGMVSKDNLAIVREGMRNSAHGDLSVIVPFRDAKISVAGKTGTAEFGVQDEEGYYTSTHAWVMGFFPYEDPKYSFVVFLEGGGESNNAASLAREFIDWMADSGKFSELTD